MATLLAIKGRPFPPFWPFLFYCAYVTGLQLLSHFFGEEKDSITGKVISYAIGVDSKLVTFVGTALFFVMSLRMNSSYDRSWWEGRKVWGMMINRTRDISRQAACYMNDRAHVDRLIRYTIAFAVTMKRHLRFERDLDELLVDGVLTEEQVKEIQGAKHMPNFILDVLSHVIRSAKKEGLLGEFEEMTLDSNLTQFEDNLGKCERILKTKMPFAYVVGPSPPGATCPVSYGWGGGVVAAG